MTETGAEAVARQVLADLEADVLALLPDNSVQVCVTSPPYFGLRDYGTATWDEYPEVHHA